MMTEATMGDVGAAAPVDATFSAGAVEEKAQDMEMMDDSGAGAGSGEGDVAVPSFPELSAQDMAGGMSEMRSLKVPPNRYTPLRESWDQIMRPIVEYMKLQIRMNVKKRCVEIKTSEFTETAAALQKASDFVQAFLMGFNVEDAIALLRLDDLYIDTFQITDVKMLKGDNLSRAIGRIAGQDGKTKFAIENATKTRIVMAHTKIHILGSFSHIKMARDAICNLILGAPPGKVYNQMRNVASRTAERF